MRKFIGISLLTVALSCSTYAGEILYGVTTISPTATPTTTTATAQPSSSTNSFPAARTTTLAVVLNLLQSVLPLI